MGQIQGLFFGTFWNFFQIFSICLIESIGAKPLGFEGWLYVSCDSVGKLVHSTNTPHPFKWEILDQMPWKCNPSTDSHASGNSVLWRKTRSFVHPILHYNFISLWLLRQVCCFPFSPEQVGFVLTLSISGHLPGLPFLVPRSQGSASGSSPGAVNSACHGRASVLFSI